MSEAGPNPAAARRRQAHDMLDAYLDELLSQEDEALASDNPAGARELYRQGLGLASNLIGADLRKKAAPNFTGNDPRAARRALVESISLLMEAWPPASRSVAGDLHEILGATGILQALQKLDNGETVAIFEPAKGAGKHKWTERRHHFLAALWAIYLERGERNSPEEANNRVAQAFQNAGTITGKSGRLPQGQIRVWRRHIEEVAIGKKDDPAIGLCQAFVSTRQAPEAVRYAAFFVAAEAGTLGTWAGASEAEAAAEVISDAGIAKFLHRLAFGNFKGGSNSLLEAGKRYQEFTVRKKEDPEAKRKRAQRAKKREINENLDRD